MTNEILPLVLGTPDPSPSSALLSDFLRKLFHVDQGSPQISSPVFRWS